MKTINLFSIVNISFITSVSFIALVQTTIELRFIKMISTYFVIENPPRFKPTIQYGSYYRQLYSLPYSLYGIIIKSKKRPTLLF